MTYRGLVMVEKEDDFPYIPSPSGKENGNVIKGFAPTLHLVEINVGPRILSYTLYDSLVVIYSWLTHICTLSCSGNLQSHVMCDCVDDI